MSPTHPDIGPELRALAQAILDRLDPAVRAAAMTWGSGQGKCQQVWCPVCALAALVTGEQHPLLSLIAEHSVTLLAMVRAMAADADSGSRTDSSASRPDSAPAAGGGQPDEADHTPKADNRYQHIPITIEE